ncbi:polyprenol monophosphomannose synthase [Thermodesulfobacteriota bacterium]
MQPWVTSFAEAEELIRKGTDSQRVLPVPVAEISRTVEKLRERLPREPVNRLTPLDLPLRMLVVLPTYNERENLKPMVRAIQGNLACDVLIVDDNSPDGTGKIADELAGSTAGVHVLHRAEKQGLGRAYMAGFEWGLERDYERLFEIDCDFSHPPWDLPRLAWAAQDYELVIGSRYVRGGGTEGWNALRRLLSTTANLYTRFFLGFGVHDYTAGFRCYSADLLRHIDFERVVASGYSFQIEMTWLSKRAGVSILELPIRFVDRVTGASKMTGAIALEALPLVALLRFRRGKRQR